MSDPRLLSVGNQNITALDGSAGPCHSQFVNLFISEQAETYRVKVDTPSVDGMVFTDKKFRLPYSHRPWLCSEMTM